MWTNLDGQKTCPQGLLKLINLLYKRRKSRLRGALKRLPGLACKYKFVSLSCIFVLFIVLYSLLSFGVICTNLEPWAHIDQMCEDFKKRESFGDLCHALCVDKGIESLSCRPFQGKEIVFTATLRGDTRIIVKSSNRGGEPAEVFHWVDSEGKEHYPSEEQFTIMVSDAVRLKLNLTIDKDEAKRLSHFPGGQTTSNHDSELRYMEMREVWALLQHQAYLMSMVHAEKEFFPELVGSCGQYYATEFLTPALTTTLGGDSSKFESWASRVHLAVSIIELIEQMDLENIILCDMDLSHFGINANGKLKVRHLNVALPKSMVDAITSDGKQCSEDTDCYFHDCKSVCSKDRQICESPVTNTNLQMVCEKILLGWALPGRLILPGLLMTSHTPQSLVSLLRQCAQVIRSRHPEELEIAKHVAQRLTDTLAELDSSLEGFRS